MDPVLTLQSFGTCLHNVSLSNGLILSLFFAGLVGGMTHCVAMCGPFVLSMSGNLQKLSGALLLPYHLGRITTYTALAMLLASVLNLAFLFLPIRSLVIAPLLMTAALIFLINAFPDLKKYFMWLDVLNVRTPYHWISNAFQVLSQKRSLISQYLIGILLGFMPCGLVVSALMAASTASSVWSAGFAMAAFGAGTIPALVMMAFFGQSLKMKFPKTMQRVTQGMMVWSAIWLFLMAGANLM